MAYNITFVGIDVGKFEFCVYRQDLGQPFFLPNTKAGHAKLVHQLGNPGNPPDSQVIALEPTGGCEWALWEALETAGFDVRQVSRRVSELLCMSNLVHASQLKEHGDNDDFQRFTGRAA